MDNSHDIPRLDLVKRVQENLGKSPVVLIQGPRQCGKTTLARSLGVPDSHYFDLDSPLDRIRLEENAFTTLSNLNGLIIIDEAQKQPELFDYLRALADRPDRPARFLLLGSASNLLLSQVSESLAGRVTIMSMGGLSMDEVGSRSWQDLWIKGSFPIAFQKNNKESLEWRLNYLQTFINRDLREIADTKLSESQIRRLFGFISATSGQAWNHSKAAQTIGVTAKTVQRHLEIFQAAFLVRELPVIHTNTHKTLRSAPTIYLRDSGLIHALLQIYDHDQILAHPNLGQSWESFALEQVTLKLQLRPEQCFTWTVRSGAEIDLVFRQEGKLFGIEFKHAEAPRTTRSFTMAFEELNLAAAAIVHTGEKSWQMGEGKFAISIQDLEQIKSLFRLD